MTFRRRRLSPPLEPNGHHRRCGFSPEASRPLIQRSMMYRTSSLDDGVADERALRTRLACKLIAIACNGRGDLQAKQSLLRTFRNEPLAAANAGHSERSLGLRLEPHFTNK